MIQYLFLALVLLCSAGISRADLTLEQQSSNGTNAPRIVTMKLHASELRIDNPDLHFDVLLDLDTRNSYTLMTNKTYIQRFGSEARWEVGEEKKMSGGTNAMDFPAAPARATGRSERMDGYDTEIYVWSGAQGITQTLWVARTFPNYEAIRAELAKLDKFNATGLHPNAQPVLSLLPGMVVKSVVKIRNHLTTNLLVSAKVDALDPSLFTLPPDYKEWKRPAPKLPATDIKTNAKL